MRITPAVTGIVFAMLAFALPAFAQTGKPDAPPTKAETDAVRAQGRYLATITMEKGGVIEVVLEGAEMPYTVANYLKLARAKFYDGLTFFNVEDTPRPLIKLIQGGDPDGDGAGGPGYSINLEISPFLRNKRGAITMRRFNAPNSAGSQFMILKSDVSLLDNDYAVFGWVKTGMNVVDAVQKGDTMKSVTVAPYAGKEACPILDVYKPSPFKAPTKADIAAVEQQGRYLATITMKDGSVIEAVLEGKEAPLTVANFVNLITATFYDGLTFHRVEPGFVIQGGDPDGNGTGGPGYSIKLEIAKSLRHKKGALSMARSSDPNSAGSQFFIMLGDSTHLDGGYAVFGWVRKGMDVVQRVKVGDGITSITVQPYAGTEPCPITANN